MQRIVAILIIAALGWYAYGKYQSRLRNRLATVEADGSALGGQPGAAHPSESTFKCDGRTYCSQMTSCAEATYFLKNCPGTKMDGNHDGVPCESQWCR